MVKKIWMARAMGALAIAAAGGLVMGEINGPETTAPPSTWVYVGSFAKAQKAGIYAFRLDNQTGKLTPLGDGPIIKAEAVGFFATHPNGKFLYAVSNVPVGKITGAVEAYSVDPATGNLKLVNRVSAAANEPVCLAIDPLGKFLVVADYSGASVALFPIESDGRLGEAADIIKHTGASIDPARQKQPYPHGIAIDPAGTRAIVADLGMDKIIEYRLDREKRKLIKQAEASVKPGEGPRHLAFANNGNFLYLVTEMGNSLTAFSVGPAGELKEIQKLLPWQDALPGPDTGAEIALRPDGKFLYVSERGLNKLMAFAIDPATGKLTPAQNVPSGGKTPRSFAIDPTGRFLLSANQDSDSVRIFSLDPTTGNLIPLANPLPIPTPVCIGFVPIQ